MQMCICTSTTQCNGLAQVVIDLLPSVDSVFKTNYTAALAYSSFWLMEGGSQGNNCAAQAVILDVGHSLDRANFPNRTQWTQTALLWNALKPKIWLLLYNFRSLFRVFLGTRSMLQMDLSITWNRPVFSITVSGYTFNFASQTVTQPPGTFVVLAHPSDAQIQKVSPAALATLDRMYTYAQGMSVYRQSDISRSHLRICSFFKSATSRTTKVLDFGPASTRRHPPNLQGCTRVSPLMLPFNASSRSIRDLYPSTSSPFPPPLSCFPNLDPAFQQQVSMFETAIFGLPTIRSNQTGFNTSCYRDRPIYGVWMFYNCDFPFAMIYHQWPNMPLS
jgi:hypothetical protein